MSMVHPHARGAYSDGRICVRCGCGSSPRTWGLRADDRGETCKTAVHPHARGAYDRGVTHGDARCGSSPRTWGLRCTPLGFRAACRFIPTHVGLTEPSAGHAHGPAVHPHARGAYCGCGCQLFFWFGSSPRTWGLQKLHFVWSHLHRFIPTHVGLTSYPAPL